MKTHGRTLPVLAAALLLLAALALPAFAANTVQDEPGSTCMICHGKLAPALSKSIRPDSVHSRFGVSCVDCHGGDQTRDTEKAAMDPAAGFKGKFTPEEVLTLCNTCHGDYERMRQFSLPIDQLQQYKTSEHGKALLLTGNRKVAVCNDCHGTHDILEVSNPLAHVYPTNVPAICAKCHSDEKYMQGMKVSTTVVEDYKKGVHGTDLLKKQDLAVPTCTTCHGNHGAAPPGVAEVVNICGQCHKNIREENQVECIDCHDGHNNRHPLEVMFTSSKKGGCLRCHNKNKSPQDAYISGVLDKLSFARRAVADATRAIKKAESHGFYVDEEKVLLQEAHTAMLQFSNMQHALPKDMGEAILETTDSKAAHIQESIKVKMRTVTDRRIVMSAVAGYLAFLLLLLFIKYRRLRRDWLRSKP